MALITGSLKHQAKTKDGYNYFGSGMLLYLFMGMGVLIISVAFRSAVCSIFNYTDYMSQWLFLTCSSLIFVDFFVSGVSKHYQYMEKRGTAAVITFCWFFCRYLVLFLLRLIFSGRDGISILKIYTVFMFLIGITMVLCTVKFHDMKVKVFDCMKYSSYDIASRSMTFLIYVFGARDMIGDAVFLTAYNIVAMCTDTQWDLQNSIDTYVSVELTTGDWDKKKKSVFVRTVQYASALLLSSVLMLLCYHFIGNVPRITIGIFLIEMVLFIPDCIGCYFTAYVSIVKPSVWLFVFGIVDKLIRLGVQLAIPSLWSIPIACLVGVALYCVGAVTLYIDSKNSTIKT